MATTTPKPSTTVQTKALNQVNETFHDYENLSRTYRERFLDIYQETYTYQERKRADWAVNNKVNKIQSIIEKVVPRIIARNPKYIMSLRQKSFKIGENNTEQLNEMAEAMQEAWFD